MNVVVVDDADRTAVGYVCLWEVKISGAKFLHLFNSCYHMVVRSSVVTLSNMTTFEWKLAKTTTDNILFQFKVLTKQKPVLFRRYIFILRGNTYYMTGTGQWCTRVC